MQETDLSGGRSDSDLIVLAHLLVDEVRDHLAGHRKARHVHVEVVDVKEDDAPAIQRNGTFEIDGRRPARGGQLALFVATRSDKFKRLNRTWFAIDAQFEIVAGQVLDEVSLLVENHHIGLDELSVNAYNVVWRSRRGRSLLRLLRLSSGGPNRQHT